MSAFFKHVAAGKQPHRLTTESCSVPKIIIRHSRQPMPLSNHCIGFATVSTLITNLGNTLEPSTHIVTDLEQSLSILPNCIIILVGRLDQFNDYCDPHSAVIGRPWTNGEAGLCHVTLYRASVATRAGYLAAGRRPVETSASLIPCRTYGSVPLRIRI